MSLLQSLETHRERTLRLIHPEGPVDAISSQGVAPQIKNFYCSEFHELIACLGLVYDEYRRVGYLNENQHGIHASPFVLFPNFYTSYLAAQDKILYTASFVLGSRFGLPSSQIFPDIIDDLESQGRLLAEGTLFAGSLNGIQALPVLHTFLMQSVNLLNLFHVDDLLISVHPNHENLWKRLFGFERLADPRACPYVHGSPGTLMRLDLEQIRAEQPIQHTRQLPFCPLRLGSEHVRRLLLSVPDLSHQLNFSQLDYLEETYPNLELLPESYRSALVA